MYALNLTMQCCIKRKVNSLLPITLVKNNHVNKLRGHCATFSSLTQKTSNNCMLYNVLKSYIIYIYIFCI